MRWKENSDNFVLSNSFFGASFIHNVNSSFSEKFKRTNQIEEGTKKDRQELQGLCDFNSFLAIQKLFHETCKIEVCKLVPRSEHFVGSSHKNINRSILTYGNEQSHQSSPSNVYRNDVCPSHLEDFETKKLNLLRKPIDFEQGSIISVHYQVYEGLNRTSSQLTKSPSQEKNQQRLGHRESIRATSCNNPVIQSSEASSTKYARILDNVCSGKYVTRVYFVETNIPRKRVKSQPKKYRNKSLSLQIISEEEPFSISSTTVHCIRRAGRRIYHYRSLKLLQLENKKRSISSSRILFKLINHQRKQPVDRQIRSILSSTQSLQSLIQLHNNSVDKERISLISFTQSWHPLISVKKYPMDKRHRRSTKESTKLRQSLSNPPKETKNKLNIAHSPLRRQSKKVKSQKRVSNQQREDDLKKEIDRPHKKESTKESQSLSLDGHPSRKNILPQKKAEKNLPRKSREVEGKIKDRIHHSDVESERPSIKPTQIQNKVNRRSRSSSQQPGTTQGQLQKKLTKVLKKKKKEQPPSTRNSQEPSPPKRPSHPPQLGSKNQTKGKDRGKPAQTKKHKLRSILFTRSAAHHNQQSQSVSFPQLKKPNEVTDSSDESSSSPTPPNERRKDVRRKNKKDCCWRCRHSMHKCCMACRERSDSSGDKTPKCIRKFCVWLFCCRSDN